MDSCIGGNGSHFSDPDAEQLIAVFRDPDPFLCDIGQVMDACIRDDPESGWKLPIFEEKRVETEDETVCENVVSSSSSSRSSTRPASPEGTKKSGTSRRSRKKASSHRSQKSYVCDWCDRKASFKSGQGLRFHKTLRCPRREAHLGKNPDPHDQAQQVFIYNTEMPLNSTYVFWFPGQNFFKCCVCSKAFVTTKGLDNHRLEFHPEEDSFWDFIH